MHRRRKSCLIPKDYWNGEYRDLNEDQTEGLSDAVDSLSEALRMVIQAKYEEHMSYQEIADLYRQPKDRIVSIHNKAIRMLKKENRLPYILHGYCGWQMMQLEEKNQKKKSVEDEADAF